MSHLKFIDKNEYSLPVWSWDGPDILRWVNKNSNGFIVRGVASDDKRPVDTGKTEKVRVGENIITGEPVYKEEPVIEYQTFYPFEEALEFGDVPDFDQAAWEAEQADEKEKEKVIKFRKKRQRMVDEAVVQVSSGKNFHADEAAQRRMLSAILAADYRGLLDSDVLPSGWSTADVPTGVMDKTVTLGELKEAHALSIENMGSIWSVE